MIQFHSRSRCFLWRMPKRSAKRDYATRFIERNKAGATFSMQGPQINDFFSMHLLACIVAHRTRERCSM